MAIDINQLVIDMKNAASTVLKADVGTFRGFSERQLQALAKQAEFVATGIAKGDIDKEMQDYFLDGIEDMTLNFAKTLRGLILVTIEKVWNAVVGVLWKAISTATNLTFSIPSHI